MSNLPQSATNSQSDGLVDRHTFLATIFDQLEDDERVCVSRATPKKDGDGVWFNNYLVTARQWRRWSPETQAQAWYFCVSTINGEQSDKGTMVGRGRKHLKRYHCLVLDDVGTKAKPPPVEPSWEITTSIVDDTLNQQWGYMLDPGDDWGRYEALVKWCAAQGWADAGAGGSYRLMRVPGSANMKPGREEYRSNVTDWNLAVWSLAEIAEELGCDFSLLNAKKVTVAIKDGGAIAMSGIDTMLNWLVDNGHVVKDDGGEWVDVLCPWADQHTTGENTAGYSPLGRGDDQYVQTRAFNCLHEHCKDRHLNEFVKWAGKTGGPHVSGYDPLPWLQSRYAYVGMTQQVVDLEQRQRGGEWFWDLTAWSKMHPGKIAVGGDKNKMKVADAFVASSRTTKADSTVYKPVKAGEDVGVVEQRGQKHINTYVPPNWEETDKPPAIFLEHVRFLFGENQDLFLDWLAWKFQNPDKRSWAIICVAEATFGVGRSWLRKALSSALQGHVRPATLAQLIGKGSSADRNYNDWGVACQFVIVEEAKDIGSREDFFHGYETFKQTVDNNIVQMRINPKYGRTREDSLWFNTLIFSNHADAMVIPEGDRRICVLPNPPLLKNEEYYEALHASLKDGEGQRIYWYLMRRDVSKFGHVYPPDTPAKLQMQENSRSPSDEIYDHVMDHLSGDIITRDILKDKIKTAAHDLSHENIADKPGGVLKHMWLRFGNLRREKHGARYTIVGVRTEVRAIRNKEKWKAADVNRNEEAILRELEKNQLKSLAALSSNE
jgi:hypothetical protein